MNKIICQNNINKISQFDWNMTVFSVSKANAQTVNSFGDNLTSQNVVSQNISNTENIPVPILLIILLFVIFVFIMSFIYIYHWNRFNMGDSFIKKAISIYLIGLIICSLPLVAFLM
jgi:hypothetical protein